MHYGLNEWQKRILSSVIDESFQSTRKKGGKTLTYVSAPYVIEVLDYLFDGCWSYEITDKWVEHTNKFDKNIKDEYRI